MEHKEWCRHHLNQGSGHCGHIIPLDFGYRGQGHLVNDVHVELSHEANRDVPTMITLYINRADEWFELDVKQADALAAAIVAQSDRAAGLANAPALEAIAHRLVEHHTSEFCECEVCVKAVTAIGAEELISIWPAQGDPAGAGTAL